MTKMNKLTKKQQWDIYEAFKDLIDLYEMFHGNDLHQSLLRSGRENVFWVAMQSTYRLDKLIRNLNNAGIKLELDDNMIIASSNNYIQNKDLYSLIKEAYEYKVEY